MILLLLIGTQILNWQWAIPIPLIAALRDSIGLAARLPSAYAVAQIVDHRMALEDSLSTAFFFSQDAAGSRVSPEVRQLQFERADRLAESVDVRKAIPYTVPRTVYLMAALILVASSLFALRYGLTPKSGFETAAGDAFWSNRSASARAPSRQRIPAIAAAGTPDQSRTTAASDVRRPGSKTQAISRTRTRPTHRRRPAIPRCRENPRHANNDAKKQATDEGEKSEGDQKDERSGDGESPNGQQGDSKQDQKRTPHAKQDSSNSGDSSSLMSKVKDAVQNLLSRMKPQQGSRAPSSSSPWIRRAARASSSRAVSSRAAKNGQQQQGGQQGDAQEGQSGEEAQNAQDPQGKGTGKSENQQPSKQPGSGIGSQDGDKSIKQAEQLAAMGKISEIFGKRSANITGEATVEVQNTSQQLRTQYAATRRTAHPERRADQPRRDPGGAADLRRAVFRAGRSSRRGQPASRIADWPYSQARLATPRSRSFTRSYR